MSGESDIKGVAICVMFIVMALGAGLGCFAGTSQLISGDPKASLIRTVAAGAFCVLMINGIVGYVRQRRSK